MAYLILFDESDESGALDLNWLTRFVIKCNNKMEEIAFPQIGRGLLLEMSSA